MEEIKDYINVLEIKQRKICQKLQNIIEKNLSNNHSKLFHGSPVWFINENPIVGFSQKQGKISLLFWSGQSFEESGLKPIGKFKAAEIAYNEISDIDEHKIVLWLEESKRIIWDYKNIKKNMGELELLR